MHARLVERPAGRVLLSVRRFRCTASPATQQHPLQHLPSVGRIALFQHTGRIRRLSSCVRSMSPAMTAAAARFSANSDEQALKQKLEPLLTAAGGRWTLLASGEGLERQFKFKTFTKTWDFMTAVSLQCKIQNHHPEWSNVYNITYVRWTTHSPRGLSAKDIQLATICDSLARDFGEIVEEGESANPAQCELKSLADKTADGAGDCCTPKPKS